MGHEGNEEAAGGRLHRFFGANHASRSVRKF
jgi:hypothetical protein